MRSKQKAPLVNHGCSGLFKARDEESLPFPGPPSPMFAVTISVLQPHPLSPDSQKPRSVAVVETAPSPAHAADRRLTSLTAAAYLSRGAA